MKHFRVVFFYFAVQLVWGFFSQGRVAAGAQKRAAQQVLEALHFFCTRAAIKSEKKERERDAQLTKPQKNLSVYNAK